MKTVFCIIGESGSGKTEIVKELEYYGYKVIQSYTTRPARKVDEWGHIFCSDVEYEKFRNDGEIVAYSYFNNYHYFSTKAQMYNCDVYVVDPDGIEDLKSKVNDIRFITISLNVDMGTRINRMTKRGDSLETIAQRLNVDAVKFKNKKYDYCVPNDNITRTLDIIRYIMDAETDASYEE